MNITDKEAKIVVEALLKDGLIAESNLEQILGDSPSEEMKAIVTYLHAIACTDYTEGCSCGMSSEGIDDWKAPMHTEWVSRMRKFMRVLDINEGQLLNGIVVLSHAIMSMGGDRIALSLLKYVSISPSQKTKP